MKKKILFMVINMNIGGTEKALLNMIAEIPRDKYDITVFMLEEKGGFLKSLPSHVNIRVLDNYTDIKWKIEKSPRILAEEFLTSGEYKQAFTYTIFYLIEKLTKDKSIYMRYILRDFSVFDGGYYDLAIAYAGPMDLISYYVSNMINAKYKVQWIHFDITKIGFNKFFAKKIYIKFNRIFVVSEEGKDKLKRLIPKLNDRIDIFSNVLSNKTILKLADLEDGFVDDYNGIRILTVGRLSKEKGQDLAISVLSRLRNEGYNVRWYFVGEGNSKEEYTNLAKNYGIENDIIFLGSTSNPYPYIKQCDMYVQTSRHEGYCITLAEARSLCKPIISTDFNGAKEQLKQNETGYIVKFNQNEMYEAIKRLIGNRELREKLSSNLRKEEVDTTRELEKLYSVIDGS
ncbi:glycosyltransferase [Bacillus sp. AK128]